MALDPIVGVNCYFLGFCQEASRKPVLEMARALGANTIRSAAFLDVGEPRPGGVSFQYFEDGAIRANEGPDGLERLDALIAAAEEAGVQLILPLINYWDDFGGMRQYLRWLNLPVNVEEFYKAPAARAAYQNWVRTVVTRRNTRTGRLYLEEPSILCWELANEPRCEIPGGADLLLEWVGEMSAFVKAIDGTHLVACGDEGFFRRMFTFDHLYNGSHGVDFESILALPDIDIGTFHLYPTPWGRGPAFGQQWISDHIEAGRKAGKPVLLEEYGIELNPQEPDAMAVRNEIYAGWLNTVADEGGAGDLLWMLGGEGEDVKGFRDAYTILRAEDFPALPEHAARMGVV